MGTLVMTALFAMFTPAEAERHLAAPLTQAAPVSVELAGVGHWVGVSWRGGSEADFGAGTAAFYYNGPETEPATDFVREVSQGREAALSGRLLELRWREDGRLVRKVDHALMKRLGFSPEDTKRLLPLPQAANSLYF